MQEPGRKVEEKKEEKELPVSHYDIPTKELDLICLDAEGKWKFNEDYEGFGKYTQLIEQHQSKSVKALVEELKQLSDDEGAKRTKKTLLALIVIKAPRDHEGAY